jgi:hypothetical protein
MYGGITYGSNPYAHPASFGPSVPRVPGVAVGYDFPAAWADGSDVPAGASSGAALAASGSRSRSTAGAAASGTDLAAGGSNIGDVEAGT